jgi:hypothetical protein
MAAPTPIATPSHLCRCLDPAQDEGIKRKRLNIDTNNILNNVLFFIFNPPFEAFYLNFARVRGFYMLDPGFTLLDACASYFVYKF